MKIVIDSETQTISAGGEVLPLYGRPAFELVSQLWLKLSWVQKYSYTFTWMGRPIIQHPEDLVRMQEVIHELRPDVIVETGIAHGGSLIFFASLMKAMGHGRLVIGVDIEIRPANRAALEAHPLAPAIRLIEGDSAAAQTVAQVAAALRPREKVLVVLDSDHSRAHVLRELEAYHALVTPGSYLIATDGILRDLGDVPRGRPEWRLDNPAQAARDFVAAHPEFALEPPRWRFNESPLEQPVTGWPDAWIRRLR